MRGVKHSYGAVKDFLIEIGTEELPAGSLDNAVSQLKEGVKKLLDSCSLVYDEPKIYYTPRRLALLVTGIPERQEDKNVEVYGPPKEFAYDKDGNLNQAGIGFAKSQGVPPESLTVKQKGKKEVISCEKKVSGKPTIEILKSTLPDIIKNIKFKKSMRWEPTGVRFARPIRWLVALFGEEVVEFELAGVKSGNVSQSLRGEPPITIDSADKYEQLLEAKGIIPDPQRRKNKIESETMQIKKERNLLHHHNNVKLLEEVKNLVEAPRIVLCKFDEKYLSSIPPEVIITAMRVHQRYFALVVDKTADLSNYFVVVANTKDDNVDKIKEGYEKVLIGRLEDAEFYYKEDKKIPLENRVEELKKVVWQEGLGTLYQKTQRLIELSRFVAKYIKSMGISVNPELLEQSAKLCKADLGTNMIKDGKEFTELEGIYGSILAKEQNKPEVSTVIKYMVGRGPIGIQPESITLKITDRIDSIAGAFIINKGPTGSKDPLGIRRAGNEFIRIINESMESYKLYGGYKEDRLFSVPLKELINKTLETYKNQKLNFDTEVVSTAILSFLMERFKSYLDSNGIRYDIINAVLEIPNDDLVDLFKRAKTLDELKEKEEFTKLAMLAKRVRNILKSSELKGESLKVKNELLQEKEEKELYDELNKKEKDFNNYIEQKDYGNALVLLLNLSSVINNFFDKVLVMAPEPELKNNRLALLGYLSSLFQKIADFSQIAE